jgi:hypothetical protein
MRRHRIARVSVGMVVLFAALAAASVGPTRVGGKHPGPEGQTQPIAYVTAVPAYPALGPYGAGGYVATPEIVSRIGEILAAIDAPQDRSRLAQQWLQFAKQTIAKDQEFRDAWLAIQRQQVAQQQQAQHYQLEIARLQVRIEELQAQNLRLQQENLQAQLQLSQQAAGQARLPQ